MAWETLRSIAEANRLYREQEFSRPPLACPHDGTPLQVSPPGLGSDLFCPMGDYAWPADPNPLRPGGL